MKTKEFMEKLRNNDADLIKKVKDCKTKEDVYEVAKAEGVTDSFEVFCTEMTALNKEERELSEEELESVAGGVAAPQVGFMFFFLQ